MKISRTQTLLAAALSGAVAATALCGTPGTGEEGASDPNEGVPRGSTGAEPPSSAAPAKQPSKVRSDEDGWLDLSGFIEEAYGFIPLVSPITEPAIGYGASGGLAFINRPLGQEKDGFGRPNITAVGGLATENGTWGAVIGDSRYWLDDQLQTLAGVAYTSLNLDFYGIGEDSSLQSHPLTYNLQPLAVMAQAKYRLGASRFWAGLSYTLATTQVEFDASDTAPGLPDFQSESRVGGLTPSFTYDSRNTIFTTTRGTYVEVTAGLFSAALGGDDEFQRGNVTAMHFLPLHPKLTLGLRGDAKASFGDTPFYLLPYISLRGVTAMRYMGEEVAQVEGELRWQFWKRFSLVGFAGAGAAWNNFEKADNTLNVVTGGTGFRYELARKFGLHMGVDVAFGPDGPVFYLQVGSAWTRP